jgi:CHAT domain-containing protein
VAIVSCVVSHDGVAPFGGALRELTAAAGHCRFVHGRLPGGFAYAPLVADQPCEPSLDARVIAAGLLKRARGDSARGLAPGVARLVFLDSDAAIGVLEPLARDRTAAAILTTLSAAYLERSRKGADAESAAKAVDAAQRAIWIDAAQIEAWFNRAAALEQLGFASAAASAWDDYLQRDRRSGWAAEARAHRKGLTVVDATWDTVTAALSAGNRPRAEGWRAIARDFADRCRHLVEDDLLSKWANAVLHGEDAAAALRDAAALASALSDERGDRTYDDVVRRISTNVGADRQRQIASGVLAGIRARAAIDRGDVDGALSDLSTARRVFAVHDVPADVLDLYALFVDYYRSRYADAIPGLRRLAGRADADGHVYVAARAQMILAAIAVRQARPTDAEILFNDAAQRFARGGETGYLASVRAILGNRYRERGDTASAWTEIRDALRLLGRVDDPQHAYAVLHAGSFASEDGGLPGMAEHFSTALLGTAERWRNPVVLATTLAERAWPLAQGRDPAAGLDVIARARAVLPEIADPYVRELTEADIARAEARALASQAPCEAVRLQTTAIETLSRVASNRLPVAFLERGRSFRACGRVAEAEADFRAGIEVFEGQRPGQRGEQLRISMFDAAWDLYGELIRVLAIDRGQTNEALVVAERARARTLDEAVNASTPHEPIEIQNIQRTLAPDVTIVEYAVVSRAVVAWTITRSAVGFVRLPATPDDVAALVADWRALVLGGRDERAVAGRLYDALIRPIESSISNNGRLIIAADGALHHLSFAALWDGQRYLVERCALWSVPSLAMMAWADRELERRASASPTLLAVGDPAFSSRRFPWLSRLIHAAREAGAIAPFYRRSVTLVGADASKRRILDATRTADVVHIAAHAVANPASPVDSYIVTAADPGRDDDLITAADLATLRPLAARLIVLSACQTAAGRTARGEGVLSLARAFLAAGVPSAISNLWDASDSASYDLFVTLHRELVQGRSAADALRAVQLHYLRGASEEMRRPRVWAGVVGIGAAGAVMKP